MTRLNEYELATIACVTECGQRIYRQEGVRGWISELDITQTVLVEEAKLKYDKKCLSVTGVSLVFPRFAYPLKADAKLWCHREARWMLCDITCARKEYRMVSVEDGRSSSMHIWPKDGLTHQPRHMQLAISDDSLYYVAEPRRIEGLPQKVEVWTTVGERFSGQLNTIIRHNGALVVDVGWTTKSFLPKEIDAMWISLL